MNELTERLRIFMQLRFSTPSKIDGNVYQMVAPDDLEEAFLTLEAQEARIGRLTEALKEGLAAAEMVGISDSYDTLLEAKRKTVVWSALVAQKVLSPTPTPDRKQAGEGRSHPSPSQDRRA